MVLFGSRMFLGLLFIVVTFCTVKGAKETTLSEEIQAEIDESVRPELRRPRILSSASQLSVLIGDTILFPCRVKHMGSFVLMWKRGRTRALFVGSVRVDNNEKFSLVDNTSLQIYEVTPEYSGEYSCQISTSPPIELVHTLHILVPPSVTAEPNDGHVIVKKGEPILIQCNAEGYPAPVITWRAIKGSLPGGMKEKQGSVLAIPSADTHHSGVYKCEADNDVGEPATALVRVKVLYAPELSVFPTWVHAGVGSTVDFTCTASAEPSATLHWTRTPGSTLHEDHHVTLLHSSPNPTKVQLILRMRRITQDYFGSYACFANNSLGSAFRTVEVSGLAEPVKFKSNSSGEEEHSFMLMWTVKSYSAVIEYMLRVRPHKSKDSSGRPEHWIDVMIPVETQQNLLHSHSYNITGLEPRTGYEVVMQARNDFGWNHPSETFTFYTYGGEPQADEHQETTLEQSLLHVYATGSSLQQANLEDETGESVKNKSEAKKISDFVMLIGLTLSLCILL